MEEALIEVSTMRRFAGINLISTRTLDVTRIPTMHLLAVPPFWPAVLGWQHPRQGIAITQRQQVGQVQNTPLAPDPPQAIPISQHPHQAPNTQWQDPSKPLPALPQLL